jgi:hypothetical protein
MNLEEVFSLALFGVGIIVAIASLPFQMPH